MALVLGLLAGFFSLRYGASRETSMLATFFGAFIPVFFYARGKKSSK